MLLAVVAYLVIANIVSFALFGLDKRRAEGHQWRISERTLLLSGLMSGTLGAWLGMSTFRHKSSKRSFQIRLAVMSAIDALVAIVFALLWTQT